MDDKTLRFRIYQCFATTGVRPTLDQMADWVGDRDATLEALQRLARTRAVVLDEDGDIRMALPFSGVQTPHVVSTGSQRWFANCAWDALAIPLLVEADASITSTWLDTGDRVQLVASGGMLTDSSGFVSFGVPVRDWWGDIVET